jgi:hypothetical protein
MACSARSVGAYNTASNVVQTLVESWNGTTWSIIPSPNQGTATNYLSTVSCSSSISCVAAGFYFNASSVEQTLVEGWNGSSWAIIASPNRGTGNNELKGASCLSSGGLSRAYCAGPSRRN